MGCIPDCAGARPGRAALCLRHARRAGGRYVRVRHGCWRDTRVVGAVGPRWASCGCACSGHGPDPDPDPDPGPGPWVLAPGPVPPDPL
eukprot:scaffold88615_cov59-Phaeocystis_antarctica.AAC.4